MYFQNWLILCISGNHSINLRKFTIIHHGLTIFCNYANFVMGFRFRMAPNSPTTKGRAYHQLTKDTSIQRKNWDYFIIPSYQISWAESIQARSSNIIMQGNFRSILSWGDRCQYSQAHQPRLTNKSVPGNIFRHEQTDWSVYNKPALQRLEYR